MIGKFNTEKLHILTAIMVLNMAKTRVKTVTLLS